eukprot:64326-Pyramimonas_sp.AAC.1
MGRRISPLLRGVEYTLAGSTRACTACQTSGQKGESNSTDSSVVKRLRKGSTNGFRRAGGEQATVEECDRILSCEPLEPALEVQGSNPRALPQLYPIEHHPLSIDVALGFWDAISLLGF